MRPNADQLIRWYKDMQSLYVRIPGRYLYLFGEYLRDLTVEDFHKVMDVVKESHIRKLRSKAAGGMYGN